jgi:hypothetical protein
MLVDQSTKLTHVNDPNNSTPYQRVPVSANAHEITMATTAEVTASSVPSVLKTIQATKNWRKLQLHELCLHASTVKRVYTSEEAHFNALYAAVSVVSSIFL